MQGSNDQRSYGANCQQQRQQHGRLFANSDWGVCPATRTCQISPASMVGWQQMYVAGMYFESRVQDESLLQHAYYQRAHLSCAMLSRKLPAEDSVWEIVRPEAS